MSKETKWESVRKYSSALATELADWNSIRQDLEFTIRAVELTLELSHDPPSSETSDDGVRRLSLWNAALVAYARGFKTGVRQVRLDEDMFRILGDRADRAVEAHRYLINQRDKFVAHSVNRSEHVGVGVMVFDGKVSGIGPYSFKQLQVGRQTMKTLRSLARTLHTEIGSRINKMHREVLEEAKKLTPDELSRLPAVEWSPVKVHEAGRRRRS